VKEAGCFPSGEEQKHAIDTPLTDASQGSYFPNYPGSTWPESVAIWYTAISSLNALCLNLTPCPLSFKGEGGYGDEVFENEATSLPTMRPTPDPRLK